MPCSPAECHQPHTSASSLGLHSTSSLQNETAAKSPKGGSCSSSASPFPSSAGTASASSPLHNESRSSAVSPSTPLDETTANSQQQLGISDPNELVQLQISNSAQQGNPQSQPWTFKIHVPSHTLQRQKGGSSCATLQQVLTKAITQAQNHPAKHAAMLIQTQINSAFQLGSGSASTVKPFLNDAKLPKCLIK